MATAFTTRVDSFFKSDGELLVDNHETYQAPYYQKHFAHSKEAIARGFEGVQNTALILGAGRGFDLPLEKLAARFKHIVLVDMDLEQPRRAVESLPQEQRSQFTIEKFDLTGLYRALGEEVEKLVSQKLGYDQFIDRIFALLPKLAREELDYDRLKASFVCSSLICSQLSGQITLFIRKVCQEYYHQELTLSPEKEQQLNDFCAQVQIRHVQDLHRLVDSGGVVYFADHFSCRDYALLSSELEEREVFLDKMVFPWAVHVQNEIKRLFSIRTEEGWTWGLLEHESVGTATVDEQVLPVQVEQIKEFQITALTLLPTKV